MQAEECQDYYSFMNGISHISSLLCVYAVVFKRDFKGQVASRLYRWMSGLTVILRSCMHVARLNFNLLEGSAHYCCNFNTFVHEPCFHQPSSHCFNAFWTISNILSCNYGAWGRAVKLSKMSPLKNIYNIDRSLRML